MRVGWAWAWVLGSKKPERKNRTHIPMSQRILSVFSDESMLASTSHECSTVSPITTIIITTAIIYQYITCISHRTALTFKKMIQTAIPWNLKFRPNAHGSPTRLGDDDALDNAFHVSLYNNTHFQFWKGRSCWCGRVTWKSIAH